MWCSNRSRRRPQPQQTAVSNDPDSEAAFKTLKYAPAFPTSFGSLADARAFCEQFFGYYNHEHRHAGIGFVTPDDEHEGRGEAIRKAREAGLEQARLRRPAWHRQHRNTDRTPEPDDVG